MEFLTQRELILALICSFGKNVDVKLIDFYETMKKKNTSIMYRSLRPALRALCDESVDTYQVTVIYDDSVPSWRLCDSSSDEEVAKWADIFKELEDIHIRPLETVEDCIFSAICSNGRSEFKLLRLQALLKRQGFVNVHEFDLLPYLEREDRLDKLDGDTRVFRLSEDLPDEVMEEFGFAYDFIELDREIAKLKGADFFDLDKQELGSRRKKAKEKNRNSDRQRAAKEKALSVLEEEKVKKEKQKEENKMIKQKRKERKERKRKEKAAMLEQEQEEVLRPCDYCRKQACRCDRKNPCSSCVKKNIECTRVKGPRKVPKKQKKKKSEEEEEEQEEEEKPKKEDEEESSEDIPIYQVALKKQRDDAVSCDISFDELANCFNFMDFDAACSSLKVSKEKLENAMKVHRIQEWPYEKLLGLRERGKHKLVKKINTDPSNGKVFDEVDELYLTRSKMLPFEVSRNQELLAKCKQGVQILEEKKKLLRDIDERLKANTCSHCDAVEDVLVVPKSEQWKDVTVLLDGSKTKRKELESYLKSVMEEPAFKEFEKIIGGMIGIKKEE